MNRSWILLLLISMAACNGKDDTVVTDDTDTDTDTDTDEVYLDEDEDGYTSDVDCDDNNFQINPGADEICDEIDNNCDGTTDEGFDVDGDTFLSAAECSFGTDCNDDDDSIYPGASEVPYDGIDQDCDEKDLTDVDGDSYDAIEAGGDDCDDNNPDVNPGAEEIPKDSIDNDCKDGDSKDGDGDGYDDEAEGGTDCDDTDPEVYPGHIDWFDDGIDSDCDGDDAEEMKLEDASVTLLGDASSQDLLGFSGITCDIDGDGTLDLVVSAPFSSSYNGRIGIFYGANYATWTTDMALGSADTVISGNRNMFFGMGLACGDMDGDGNDDLAIGRGEINFSTYVSDFEVVMFYGNGSAWSATMSDTDGDAQIKRKLGVLAGVGSVYSTQFGFLDMDGDGNDDLYVNIAASFTDDDEGELLVLKGDRFSGVKDLNNDANWVFVDDDGDGDASSQLSMWKVGDLDGNGTDELLIGQPFYSSDPDATEPPTEGRIAMLNIPAEGTHDVSTLEYANLLGTNDARIGVLAIADIDNDGKDDALVSGPLYNPDDATPAQGIVYYVSDIAGQAAAATTFEDIDILDFAKTTIIGDGENSLLGFTMEVLGDLNGDGYREILVREPFLYETEDSSGTVISSTTEDRIWVISGEALSTATTTEVYAEDVRIQEFEYELDGAETGNNLIGGDIDGDGSDDIIITAYAYPDATTGAPTGKVYLYLSNDWGW